MGIHTVYSDQNLHWYGKLYNCHLLCIKVNWLFNRLYYTLVVWWLGTYPCNFHTGCQNTHLDRYMCRHGHCKFLHLHRDWDHKYFPECMQKWFISYYGSHFYFVWFSRVIWEKLNIYLCKILIYTLFRFQYRRRRCRTYKIHFHSYLMLAQNMMGWHHIYTFSTYKYPIIRCNLDDECTLGHLKSVWNADGHYTSI